MFTITESSLRWYVAQHEARSSHFGIGHPPALPMCDRSLSRSPKEPGSQRGTVSNSPYECDASARQVLDIAARQGFRVNSRMVQWVLRQAETDTHGRQIGTLLVHSDQVVFTDAFYDWRGRVYTISGEAGSLQTAKAMRACMDAPEAVTITEDAPWWKATLAIWRHEGWATTLAEAKAFIAAEAAKAWSDIDFMGVRAALALIEVAESGKTAVLVEQDATCSGFQHMALLGGDRELAEVVNATVAKTRGDLYAEVARVGGVADSLGLDAAGARKVSKKIVMLTGYGAGAPSIALSYFNDRFDGAPFESIEEAEDSGARVTFYGLGDVTITEIVEWLKPIQKALLDRFSVIRRLQQAAIAYWAECDEAGDEFRWTMADGFEAIRVRPKAERGGPEDCSKAGALPNIIHSLDGYVVREVMRSFGVDHVLGVIHDAFLTTADQVIDLQAAVQGAYRVVHADYGTNFPIERRSRCLPIGMCVGV